MQFLLSYVSNFSRRRILNRYRALVPSIRRRQQELAGSDPAALTASLRSAAEPNLVDACANVLIACDQLKGRDFQVMEERLTWNILPFDSQILGGLVLFHNQVAEMATGEGKTLAAIFAAYLGMLKGRKVHIVTANDYLAQRDSIWMKPVYDKLGCTVGLLTRELSYEQRQAAYRADVLYATSSALIFDYLGDKGLITDASQRLQQGLDFAIVDEADSVLIDEARTPIVISGRKETDLSLYKKLHKPVREVHRMQEKYVSGLEKSVTDLIAKGNPDAKQLGRLCYQILQADPNNQQLLEWGQDSSIRNAAEKFQLDVDANPITKAELHNLGFYSISQRDHTVHLSDDCQEQFSKLLGKSLVIPDLSAQINRLERAGLAPEEQERQREALSKEVEDISSQLNVIQQLIKAYALYRRDIEYIVREGEIVLIDANTGRLLPGRHLSDGLHQAVELKEGMKMSPESQVLAETSIQNYFRQYKHLGGMTGTATIDADEFLNTYRLDVIPIPPHRKCIRESRPDLHFMTHSAKMKRLVDDIARIHAEGRPILIGTSSVQESELVSTRLTKLGLQHTVLNAKNHAREAMIIAEAGQRGSITIATSMAGRGTDIKLAKECVPLGGLHIVGTTRYYLRRLDEQLLGRCARQGDPGSIQFYLSLEDDLFKDDKVPVARYMRFFPATDTGIHQLLVNKVVEDTQAKFSSYYHSMRRQLVSFDNVVAVHRLRIFAMRQDILDGALSSEMLLQQHLTDLKEEERSGLDWFRKTLPIGLPDQTPDDPTVLVGHYKAAFEPKIAELGLDQKRFEQFLLLSHLDEAWRDYITSLSVLKEGAQLQTYAQSDPVVDFSNKSAKLFITFTDRYRDSVFRHLFPAMAELKRTRPQPEGANPRFRR